jgi:hypothetical protein
MSKLSDEWRVTVRSDYLFTMMVPSDVRQLIGEIDRAEARIEQLEADNARLETERGTLRGMYNVATQRNQQLEAALHFYADDHEYPSDGPWGINSDDFGNAARAALKEKPE